MLNESLSVVQDLHTKYASNPYMIGRLHSYITNQVPTIMESMDTHHQQRLARTEELNIEFDAFIKSFMVKNRYFYVSATERFFYYDGVHYRVYSEDGILHHILTTITTDRNLLSWKYKTKVSIMKRIKENPLLTSVPESETIQTVLLSLYPSFFSSKTATKYFLTCLGDNILKKKTNLIHLLPPYAKAFIRELNNYCQINIGTNMTQSFKLRYYDHDYSECRVLHMNETVKYATIWKHLIEELGMDLICVAAHYSERYENSEEFIAKAQDATISKQIFYLRDHTAKDIVVKFQEEYITTTAGMSITWKNLQYLWKRFLNGKQLPAVIFQAPLKAELVQLYPDSYCETTDVFNGISSKFLPEIQRFIQFWDTHMVEDETESGLELEEIRILSGRNSFSDEQILDLIQYFYPNVIVENDKYIQEIRCIIWNKTDSLQQFFETIRTDTDISVYDAYVLYCKQAKPMTVSKSYFENYVAKHMDELRVFKSSWF